MLVLIDFFQTTLFSQVVMRDLDLLTDIINNLKIIRDNKLRKLFTKGRKYRKNKAICFGKDTFDIIAGLNEPIEAWCIIYGNGNNFFNEWKLKMILKVDS